jgi:LuxR family maltose regulon positive regulatory protein
MMASSFDKAEGVPLLATKLHIPPARPDVVSRPRLIERLDEGLHPGRKLTLVSAPAGFGKTTLLNEWANERESESTKERCVAWLSLDETDNDLTRFLRYTTAALARAARGLTVDGGPAAPTGGAPPSFQSTLVPLINQLAGRSAPLALVIDDYHLISDPAIDEALVFLVDNAPPALHLVVATRADPSFPLPRWRARQQLLEIRADDLRFTRAETMEFLQTTLDLTLDERDLDALDARAEGWIAALQLAALSMQRRQDVSTFVEAFSGSHRYLLDYLVEEVLQQQTPAVRAFLLRTSVLERLSAALCDAILEDPARPAQETLTALERTNLFLVPLDDERRWYRYHRLFHDFLRARLEIEQPDLVPVLHRRAARWHADAGATNGAIHHALAAEHHDLAAALIGEAYPAMLQRGEVATLRRWVEALPASQRRSDPVLMLAYAWTRALSIDVAGTEGCLAELQRMAETHPDLTPEQRVELRGETATIRTVCAYPRGDMEATIEYAEQALAQLPEEEGVLRSVLALYLANARSSRGEMDAAAAAYEQAMDEGRRSGNFFVAFSALLNLGNLRRLRGRWRVAEARYEEALAWSETHQAQPLDGLAHVGLGLVHWDRWEPADARRHLELGIQRSPLMAAGYVEALAAQALACIAQHQGREQEAGARLEQALAAARSLDNATTAGFAAVVEMQCQIARGDREGLARSLAGRQPPGELPADLRALEAQVAAHARLALGDPRAALDELAAVREEAESAGWTQRLVEVLVLEVQAHGALGERRPALSKLERALDLSRSGGFLRPFVQAGEPLHPLLQDLASDSSLSTELRASIETVLAALDLPLEPSPAAPELIDPLTDRELDVLHLLPTELTTAEIAERLYISYHTVRTHLKHIYSKLDAHSRHEAVTRARTLDLL